MRYYITDVNLIPLKEQKREGYSLQQAIARYNREIKELQKLFNLKQEEIQNYYKIINNNGEIVL